MGKAKDMRDAAMAVVTIEKDRELAEKAEREKREELIAQTYRMMGRIETADMFGKLATVSSLVWLKQVKESKVYKDMPGVGTWETFCNRLGKTRRLIDEQLANLGVLGGEFLETVSTFSLGYRELKKLRSAVTSGDVVIDADYVVIGDERIPLSPENRDDLEAAFTGLLEQKDKALEDAQVTLKAKDRVLEAKSKVIRKQEKELAKYETQVKARGFEPGEEAFIQEMENLKVLISGYAMKLDPSHLPEDHTVLMRSAYIETIGHARRTFAAYYDEATNLFGDESDDDWGAAV